MDLLTFIGVLLMSLTVVFSRQHNRDSSSPRDWGPWTGWSVCSESCGYGTAYRIRRCHAHHRHGQRRECDGPSKQHQICIIRNCTTGGQDYRSKECAKHNTVYYGQQTYRWVPYINDASPCELSCKSVGYGYYARFRKTVQDGVICNEEKTAVCMEGKCVESGCDGVLGSGTQVDRCGVCGGDGTSCRVIRGIFTRTHLTHRGYNIVTTIPAGACSINITEMKRSKNHLALSTPAGYFLNGDMRLRSEGNVKGAGTIFSYKRRAGEDCPGECLTAPGPLNVTLRVELIYFGRNPGIFYQFTVPRDKRGDVIDSMSSSGTDNHQKSTGYLTSSQARNEQRSSDSGNADLIPRIRHGQSPVYLSDTDSQNQRQALKSSIRVTSSKFSSDTNPNNLIRLTSNTHSAKTDYSRPTHRAASEYLPRQQSRWREQHRKSHPHRDKARSHHSSDRAKSREEAKSNVLYEPTKGQFYLKNANGSIQYKHYYHTNVHDDIGDVPVAKPAADRRSRTDEPKRNQGPSWLDDNAIYDDRYAEFRATTQYQPTARSSSMPNVISASIHSRTGVGPSALRANTVSNPRTYRGYDNQLTGGRRDDRQLYSWRITGFTECSEPCGGGLQDTRVACLKSDSQVEVIEENCDPNLKPSSTTVVCNNQPCDAGWDLGEWGPCSVTCGRGLQERAVECKQKISPTLTISVTASKCPQPRPLQRQFCQLDPCFTWRIADWGKCSTECGFGQRVRTITCVNASGEGVSERMCTQVKPEEEEICDMGSCAQGWFHTRWNKQCSADCGRGYYHRQVYCSAADGSRLNEKKCGDKNSKPRQRKTCKADKPCGGQWFIGPWFPCNATCGTDAYRQRDVLCIKRHGKRVNQVVKEHNCNKEDKPVMTEPCGPYPACKPQWFMMHWSECSKSCGTGVKMREVKCLDASLTPSPDCDKEQKPSRRQPCNTQSCGVQYTAPSEGLKTTNEALQKDGSSLRATLGKHHSGCTDRQNSRWCQLARQARLCYYPHYKKICCHTCRKLDPNPHAVL